MKKPGNKKLLKSNRISGFQKADRQKLPIDKTRRIISQKFHFFKIFKVGLIGALIFGILFELALEHVPGLLLWSIYGIIVTVILKEIWDIVKERYKSTDEYKNMMSSSQSPWQKTVIPRNHPYRGEGASLHHRSLRRYLPFREVQPEDCRSRHPRSHRRWR